ncbi:MAG: hypothetical protein AAGK21_14375, partial [Bacteroidota bacterium]
MQRKLLFSGLAAAGVGGLVIAFLRYGLSPGLLLTVIGLLLTAVVGLVVSAMRARRRGGSIEDALKAQSEREAASYTPDRKAEIDRMQESFDLAIAKLKASNLGGTSRFGRGKRALYA